MRQRRGERKYEEMVARCRDTLTGDLDADARAWWVRWQMEAGTLANLARDQFLEPSAWAALDSLREKFPSQSPPTLADIRVDLQWGIAQRARAEAIITTGDLPHLSADQQRQAARLLDDCVRRFAGLAKQIARPLASTRMDAKQDKPADDRRPSGSSTTRQIQLLRYQLAYEEAKTRLMLASMQPAASEARQRQARDAQLRLSSLTRITSDPAVADLSRLLEVSCLRLQDKDREADELLRRLSERAQAQADKRLSLRVMTEEFGSTGNRPQRPKTETWNRLRDAIAEPGERDPDLDAQARLALIWGASALLADARRTTANQDETGETPLASETRERPDAWRAEIQRQRDYLTTHHPRWRSLQAERMSREPSQPGSPSAERVSKGPAPKADPDTDNNRPRSETTASPAPASKPRVATAAERTLLNALIQTVNERKAQGNLDSALEPCEQAAALARKIGEEELAFQLSFQAAAIFHQRQDHEESFRRFRDLALEFPRHARAAEAHAIAMRHAAVAPQPIESIIAWEPLLREHLQHWPEGKSANACRLQLGRYLEQQGRSEEATAILMESQGESDVWPDTWVLLRAAFLRQLQSLDPHSKARDAFTQAVAAYWRRWDSNSGTKALDAEHAAAIVHGSEWALLRASDLTRSPQSLRSVQRNLDAVTHANTCPEELKPTLQVLSGFAAARAGNPAAARDAWKGLSWNSLDTTLPLLEELDRLAMADASTKASAEEWNRLESEILSQLQRVPSWADNPRMWQLTARIHQRRGERAEARRIYDRLLQKMPRDLTLRREAAGLFDTGDSEDDRKASLQNWQAFLEASDPGSNDWFDGQYGLIRALLRSGQRETAQAKFDALRTAHPELGGEQQATRFRQLFSADR